MIDRLEMLRALLFKVRLHHFVMPVHMSLEGSNARGEYLLRIEACVRDRDTGEPTRVLGTEAMHSTQVDMFLERPSAFFDFVRYMLMRQMQHELDEAFRVEGVRAYDPHRGEEYTYKPAAPHDDFSPSMYRDDFPPSMYRDEMDGRLRWRF